MALFLVGERQSPALATLVRSLDMNSAKREPTRNVIISKRNDVGRAFGDTATALKCDSAVRPIWQNLVHFTANIRFVERLLRCHKKPQSIT